LACRGGGELKEDTVTTWQNDRLHPAGGGPLFGVLTSHVFEAEGTQHVFYQGVEDQHIYELWWPGGGSVNSRDLTSKSGAPSGPDVLISHVFEAEGTQHVFYPSFDKHINELWWPGEEDPSFGDLTQLSGAPLAADPLTSHVFNAEGTQHVFYVTDFGNGRVGNGGHIIELSWSASESLHQRDLTLASGPPFPPLAGRLTSHVFDAEGTQHIFYEACGHIIELWWRGAEKPHQRDLTDLSGAPLGGGGLSSHVFNAEGTQHVFYVAENRHIIELWWRSGETPHPEDLTDRSGGAPLPFLGLTSHVFDAEGTQHVFYRADNGHIIEIWWGPGETHQEDLTDRSPGAPLAVLGGGDAISHVFKAEGTQHVFYASTDNLITELWSEA
jgi:hypothetical protein